MRQRSADIKLIQAFFKLLETKNYAKISVAEIVAEASLSRTTFYRYYTFTKLRSMTREQNYTTK